MCSVPQDIMDKLETTVRQFLDEGRMFTGYDVTIETRTRENMHLRHQDVRDGIHEIPALVDAMDYGWDEPSGQTRKWQKSQQNMPGGGWAFIYHPTNLDPKHYQPRQTTPQKTSPTVGQVKGHAPSVPSLSIASDGATTDSGGEQDDGSFATDYRNRLMVPTKFLKEAGITSGDTVYIAPDATNNMILIAKDQDALQNDGLKVTTQKVERNGDLRLSSKTLKAADLQDSKFVIETADKDFNQSKVKVVEIKQIPASTGSN